MWRQSKQVDGSAVKADKKQGQEDSFRVMYQETPAPTPTYLPSGTQRHPPGLSREPGMLCALRLRMNVSTGWGRQGRMRSQTTRLTAPGKAGLWPSSWPHMAGDGVFASMAFLYSGCVLGRVKVSLLFVKWLRDHNDFCLSTEEFIY